MSPERHKPGPVDAAKSPQPNEMPDISVQHGKAFEDNLDILFDELVLATKWGRPSVLLAVQKTRYGQEKAEKELEARLNSEGLHVARIVVNDERADVPALIRASAPDSKRVYFISNIAWGGGPDGRQTYRALNLHRELFVDEHVKAVLWLTTAEASDLPRYAPDFWAFRHRVVEFVSQRAPREIRLPAGVLLWEAQRSVDLFDEPQAAIQARQDLLARLPRNQEALSTRIELHYSIGYLQWMDGDSRAAAEAFKEGMLLANGHELPELSARLLNAQGILEYEAGSIDAALRRFTEALRFRSSDRSLLINLSAANCALGRNSEAAIVGQRAIRANPADADTWNRMGYIHAAMGKPDEAISDLLKATSFAPRAIPHQETLAVMYALVDRPDEARRHLDEARQLAGPGSDSYLEILSEAILGGADRALELLRKAVSSRQIRAHDLRRDPNFGILFEPEQLAAVAT